MSFENERLSCAACGLDFNDNDDVVYCPVCGAAHHRKCYNNVDHCALEEFHGTENEYCRNKIYAIKDVSQKPEEIKNMVVCHMCGNKYDSELARCPQCNSPNLNKLGGYVPFDFLGGVPAELDLGEGVTANEAKNFVFVNTHRYIPKFADFKNGKRVSWNWLAFIFPAPWLFSRKMYKNGVIAFALTVLSIILLSPIILQINSGDTAGLQSMLSPAFEGSSQISKSSLVFGYIGSLIYIAVSILCGLFGDLLYRNHTIRSIVKIKTDSEDRESDFRKWGGVNVLLFTAAYMAVNICSELAFLLFR